MSKVIEYYLNGKKVTKEELMKRKDRYISSAPHIIERKYYSAPLTDAEKEAKRKQNLADHDYFARMREDREEMERRN
jgi:hypothetical protein